MLHAIKYPHGVYKRSSDGQVIKRYFSRCVKQHTQQQHKAH